MSIAYWDKNPCESWHSAAPPGSPWWSREVSEWRYRVQPHIPRFADFPRWKGKRVLEIGCGIGSDALEFARAGAEMWAVDSSLISIIMAESRKEVDGYPYFLVMDAGFPPWPPLPIFDLVYAFGVIHHTVCPALVVREAWEHLKPDGEFRLMLYAKWSLKNLLRQQWESQPGVPIVRTYTARSAKRLLRGFEVLSAEKTHIFPYCVKDYRERRLVKHWWWRIMPPWLFRWLESLLGHHLLVVARKPCSQL